MENLQENYKKFFSGACYAFCLVKKFRPNASDAEIGKIVLDGWDYGFIDDDCYISIPVEFINECIFEGHKAVRDVKKVDYKKDELTENENIVMWKYNGNTHFVIMDKEGDVTWDPSGNSNTVKYGVPVSIRKFITK